MDLSIVIPTFNIGKAALQCLDSILKQRRNIQLEVIVVDDGSEDDTKSLLRDYAGLHEEVSLVFQENKGAGAARNIGLKKATGDYVWFIDSDDYISENSIRIIEFEMKDRSWDVLLFGYRYFDVSKGAIVQMSQRDRRIYDSLPKVKTFKLKEQVRLFAAISYPWNKIYKRSMIDENQLSFSETIVNNDIYFNITSLAVASNIKSIGDQLYTHLINKEDNQLTQIFDERRLNLISVLSETTSFLRTKDLDLTEFNGFKFNVLDWAITRCSGEVKKSLINYMDDELLALTPLDICALKKSYLINKNILARIEKLRLPRQGQSLTQSGKCMLSIIVPIFNVESYLEKCLQSIADQTLCSKNFEVIMIDDKSTDNSAEIANKFCERYENFRLIKLPENTPGGAGIPSNRGIDVARGEYIGFVDSDDYIEPEMFEELLLTAAYTDADVTFCDFSIFYEKEKKVAVSNDQAKWKDFIKTLEKTNNPRIIKTKALMLSPVPWRKLYKRSFLEDHRIRYPEVDCFFEDNPLHWFVVTQAKRFAAVNKSMVTHRIGRVGQTMEGKPEKLMAFATHAKIIKDFLLSSKLYDEYRIEFIRWFMDQSSWVVPKLGGLKSSYIDNLKELLKDVTYSDILKARSLAPYRLSRTIYQYFMVNGYETFGRLAMAVSQVFISVYVKLKK